MSTPFFSEFEQAESARLVMSREKMPRCPALASEGFSSTPRKSSRGDQHDLSGDIDDGVLSDDEDTFSLLSPVYHDSYESDEDLGSSPEERIDSCNLSVSPVRCELPKTPSEHMLDTAGGPAGSASLSAWETWLVNKSKEERLKLEKKTEEESFLKEQKEKEEMEQRQKRLVIEEKIQEWLKMKREQERQRQFVKLSQEEEELQVKLQKQRETQQKAQQKYRDWLQKKEQQKREKEKKEKEEARLKEDQERERRNRAAEKFKEWVAKSNERSRASPTSPRFPTSPYEKSYPSPSFYNPIPWKPIHIPTPEPAAIQTTRRKPQKQRKGQPSPGFMSQHRHSSNALQSLQRR